MTIRSPLHEIHERLGARFVDFGGWEMPVQYSSVLAEHRAVRATSGFFDVSHLGRFRTNGPAARASIRRLLCNDIDLIEPGRTQYSMMLNDAGGVIDDLIVWRWSADEFWVLPNAANHERVMTAFVDDGAPVEDLRRSTVTLAVQGPNAPDVIASILGEGLRRFRTATSRFAGATIWAAGTGYTGERGGELVVDNAQGLRLVDMLLEAGVTPCGLGARDTLRLEAGLPLWGQDLDEATSPLEAGLDFAVAWDHEFRGRDALEAHRSIGLEKRMVAFRTEGRQIPRHGHALRTTRSDGIVTSGNFSPMLERGIGLGYLTPPDEEGPLQVEMRGEWIDVERTTMPFYPAR